MNRGGSWYYTPLIARSAFRNNNHPANRNNNHGFRVAQAPPANRGRDRGRNRLLSSPDFSDVNLGE